MFKLSITKPTGSAGVIAKGTSRLRTLNIQKGASPLNLAPVTGARDVGTITPPAPILGGRGTINRGVIAPSPSITGKTNWVQALQDPMTNAFTASAQRVADTLRSGVVSGIGTFKSGFAGTAKMIGESEPSIKGSTIPKELTKGFAKYADTVIAHTDQWVQANEPDFAMTWVESKMRSLASAGVSIGLSMGLGLLTKAAGLSSVVFGVTQTGNKYTEQVKAGVPEKRAAGISSVQGLAEAAVEFLGVDTYLKLRNGTFVNILLRSLNEGAQEGLQTFNENLFDKLWDKNQTLKEGVVESIIIGCLAGFPGSAVTSVVEQSSPRGQAIKNAMKLGLSEKEAVATVDGYITSAINHAKPIVDEALQEAAKKVTIPLNIGATPKIGQKVNPLQTTSGMGTLVGQPQTVSGGVKPAPRFHLALPTRATQEVAPPQPSVTATPAGNAFSGRGTTKSIFGDATHWGDDKTMAFRIKSVAEYFLEKVRGGKQIDPSEAAAQLLPEESASYVRFAKENLIADPERFLTELIAAGDEALAPTTSETTQVAPPQISPAVAISEEEASVPTPSPEIAPQIAEKPPMGATIVPTQVGETVIADIHSDDFIARMKEQDAESTRIAHQMAEQRDKKLDDALAHRQITKKQYESIKYGGLTQKEYNRMVEGARSENKLTLSKMEPTPAPQGVRVPPSATAVAEKQPWQMTLEEYAGPERIQRFGVRKSEQDAYATVRKHKVAEWYASVEKAYAEGKQTSIVPQWAKTLKESAAESDDIIDKYTTAWHRSLVAKAVANGYPVPAKVLADYPDLQRSTPAQPSVVPPVKWGKWIETVGSRRTDGVGTGKVDTIETPVTYRLGSGKTEFRYASGSNMIQWEKAEGKALQLKDDTHSYYLREVLHENPKYKTYTVTEGRSGLGIGRGDSVKNAIANAQETILAHKDELDTAIAGAVKKNQGEANPQYVITNTSPLPADIIKSQPDPQSLYGTTVTVRGTKIGKHQDPDWQGTIQETVNDGDLVVIDRGGEAGTVRVRTSDIVSIDHLVTQNIAKPTVAARAETRKVRNSPLDFRGASQWADYAMREGAKTARDAFNIYVKDGLMAGNPRAMFDMKDMIKAWEHAVPMSDGELYTTETVTNTAPLPPGFTSSGEAVTPSYTSNEPDLATSGTGRTIPASKDDIARITVAFDDVVKAKREGKLTQATEGTYQKMFLDALKAAGVPKGALGWKDAIQYYKQSKGKSSLESRLARVAKAVEQYNNKVLGQKMGEGRKAAQSRREIAEKLRKVRQESKEKMEEHGKQLLEKAKKAAEGQKFGEELALAKAKAHEDAMKVALDQRRKNQLKTQEWITAEVNKRIKDAKERKSILDHLKSLKLSRLPADIAMRIQEVTAGVKGAEKLFEQPTDTEFAWVLEKQGIEVKERQQNVVMMELDLPALRELWNHVQGLVKVGMEEKLAIRLAQQSQVDTAVDECVVSLMEHTKPAQIPDVGGELQPVYKGNRVHEALVSVDNMFDRKQWQFQAADGYKRGALTWHLYDTLVEMEGYRIRTKNKLMEDYGAELKKAGINEKSYNAKRTLPNGQTITQAQAMFITINAMSEQNLYHLRHGHNLQDDTITQAIQSLTKQEAAFVDYMARTERGAWARVNYTYEITHGGQSLPKIDNYVHMDIDKSDPFGKHDFAELTLEEMTSRGFAKQATAQGFTKERMPRSGLRLREDPIFSFISYMMGATDYNFRAPVVLTLNGLVGDKVFAEAYTLRMGINGYKSLEKYVEHVANPSAALGLYGPEHAVDRFFRKTRGNAAVAILSARLSRFFTAGASYTTSVSQFGIKAMAMGTAQVVAHPRATMDIIKNLMPVVYDRLTNPVRIEAEIADLQQKWGNKAERIKSAANILFRVADALDIQSAAIGGLAKYQALHPEWGVEKCAYEVQREIIATHSTDLIETKPCIYMQGELARGITMFTAEATAVSNYLGYLERGAIKGNIPKAKFLNAMFWSVAVLSQVMRLADWIGSGGKDDDEWWATWWGAMVMSTIETAIPVFGNLITGSIEGRTYSLPVGFKFIETGTRSLTYFFEGNWEAGFKWAAATAGYLVGFPVAALSEIDKWVQTEDGQKPIQIDVEEIRKNARPERPSAQRPPRP